MNDAEITERVGRGLNNSKNGVENPWSLDNKRILVTGAGNGIGRALVERFSGLGAKVVGLDRHEPEDSPTEWDFMQGDVTKEEDLERGFNRMMQLHEGVDAVVANAGVRGPAANAVDLTLEDWNNVLETNLTGAFLTSKVALKYLRRSRAGKLVLISSGAGRKGYPKRSAYAASKWGVVGLAKSLALEEGPHGIAVNAVLPGLVRSPGAVDMLEKRSIAEGRDYVDVEQEFLTKAAMGTWVELNDIVNAVHYLCAETGDRVSGHTLNVDGANHP